ncbi:MAG TPA: hypothetical protein VFV34_24475 [Blastocatellia bacterium]|nr:hypothetical protein [Blastocatellia bacterium]
MLLGSLLSKGLMVLPLVWFQVSAHDHPPILPCERVAHRHRYADVGVKLVEIVRITKCGFVYADIASSVVGEEFSIADDFVVVKVEDGSNSPGNRAAVPLDKSRLSKGVVVYCKNCNQALIFQHYTKTPVCCNQR